MQRKAQTATEYLIILAVVIIVALIVVGVMGGIPGIGGGAATRASAASWASAPVAITSYAIDASDAIVLNVRNNQRNSITVTQINFITPGASNLVNNTPTVLAVGETRTLTGPQTAIPFAVEPCANAGDTYTFDVQIQYTDSATGAAYTESAGGAKLEGTCAN